MPLYKYRYNDMEVMATRRRPSTRDDKKYMREVEMNGRQYLVHYGDLRKFEINSGSICAAGNFGGCA